MISGNPGPNHECTFIAQPIIFSVTSEYLYSVLNIYFQNPRNHFPSVKISDKKRVNKVHSKKIMRKNKGG